MGAAALNRVSVNHLRRQNPGVNGGGPLDHQNEDMNRPVFERQSSYGMNFLRRSPEVPSVFRLLFRQKDRSRSLINSVSRAAQELGSRRKLVRKGKRTVRRFWSGYV